VESPFRDPPPGLKIIETLRLAPDGPVRGDAHLARLARTCATFGVPFDVGRAGDRLSQACWGGADLRARLTVGLDGQVDLETSPLAPGASRWRVRLATGVVAGDPWRRVKTTHRNIYDAARAAMPEGTDEVVFLNDRGEVCEGAITNIFLARDGRLLTPPVESGALPGILRKTLLDDGRAVERALRPPDLMSGEVFVGNSLRGLIAADLIDG